MESTFILTLVALFLGWMIIQQRRLRKYEQYCMFMYRHRNTVATPLKTEHGATMSEAAEAFKKLGQAMNQTKKKHPELLDSEFAYSLNEFERSAKKTASNSSPVSDMMDEVNNLKFKKNISQNVENKTQ